MSELNPEQIALIDAELAQDDELSCFVFLAPETREKLSQVNNFDGLNFAVNTYISDTRFRELGKQPDFPS